jgi:polyvinyl alcohol dehydrogenase (cytochrome)
MLLTLTLMALTAQAPQPAAPNGRAVFDDNCASCHATDDPRIPSIAELRERPPQAIVAALTTGAMRLQGEELSDDEKRAVAEYLAGKIVGPATVSSEGRCSSPPAFDMSAPARWPGWSPDLSNSRFQPQAGLSADQVSKLKLKWAFGFPNASAARGMLTIAGGRLFTGSQDGIVYALDAKSGCIVWAFQASAGVRAGVVIAPRPSGGVAAYFGDGRATVYALDPANGALLWSRKIEDHPSGRVTGTPVVHQDRVYVPVASGEEGQGGNAQYECCTFRGSMVALNAGTGAVLWKTYTVADEPKVIGKNAAGTPRWGPAGAGIWAPVTVDPKRRVVYGATGNMYTEPQQPTSDAVIAFDLDTGRIAWTRQLTPQDVFVTGCGANPGPNCPPAGSLGPDFDIGNAPMLVTSGGPSTALGAGRDLIVVGQKSGIGWALDPDKQGAVVWQYRAGRGSALGGMEWGSAADAERAYFPVADGNGPLAGELHAVRLDNGQRVWTAAPPPLKCGERGRGCTPGILAAITVIPGIVFAGAMDGGVRGYSTKDGSIVWEFDTNREFQTVNGVPAKGASINGPGPVVAGGMVYVNSGYGSLGGRPGNVLLAFGID